MNMHDPNAAPIRRQGIIERTDAVEVYRFDKSAKLRIDIENGRIVTLTDVITGRSTLIAGMGWQLAIVSDPDGEWNDKPTATMEPVN
jgi:hypothetical protein